MAIITEYIKCSSSYYDRETQKIIETDPLVKLTNKINKYMQKLNTEKFIDNKKMYILKTNAPLKIIVNNITELSYKLKKKYSQLFLYNP